MLAINTTTKDINSNIITNTAHPAVITPSQAEQMQNVTTAAADEAPVAEPSRADYAKARRINAYYGTIMEELGQIKPKSTQYYCGDISDGRWVNTTLVSKMGQIKIYASKEKVWGCICKDDDGSYICIPEPRLRCYQSVLVGPKKETQGFRLTGKVKASNGVNYYLIESFNTQYWECASGVKELSVNRGRKAPERDLGTSQELNKHLRELHLSEKGHYSMVKMFHANNLNVSPEMIEGLCEVDRYQEGEGNRSAIHDLIQAGHDHAAYQTMCENTELYTLRMNRFNAMLDKSEIKVDNAIKNHNRATAQLNNLRAQLPPGYIDDLANGNEQLLVIHVQAQEARRLVAELNGKMIDAKERHKTVKARVQFLKDNIFDGTVTEEDRSALAKRARIDENNSETRVEEKNKARNFHLTMMYLRLTGRVQGSVPEFHNVGIEHTDYFFRKKPRCHKPEKKEKKEDKRPICQFDGCTTKATKLDQYKHCHKHTAKYLKPKCKNCGKLAPRKNGLCLRCVPNESSKKYYCRICKCIPVKCDGWKCEECPSQCTKCNVNKPYYAGGLCRVCHFGNEAKCVICNKNKPSNKKGYCRKCAKISATIDTSTWE